MISALHVIVLLTAWYNSWNGTKWYSTILQNFLGIKYGTTELNNYNGVIYVRTYNFTMHSTSS